MRMRQIRTTVILLVLIAGVIFCAFYFEKHPFLENAGRPTPTPEPQPSPTFRAFNPIRTVEVSPTATPSPTRDPDEETAQTEMADVVTRVYTAEEGIILTFNYSPENGELPYVLKALTDAGYETKDCAGNFFFVKPHHDAKHVSQVLETEKKVLVHPFGNPLLKDLIRVSVGSKSAMEKFVEAFLAADRE